jgi:hypothetical protein
MKRKGEGKGGGGGKMGEISVWERYLYQILFLNSSFILFLNN